MRAVWILEWARSQHFVRIGDPAADVILVALVHGHREGRAELAARLSVGERTADWRLRKRRLPTLRAWATLARALHAADMLQSGVAPLMVASRLGYVDHSGLTHLIQRTTGYTPTEAAKLDGWQELVRGWWKLQGMSEKRDRRAA